MAQLTRHVQGSIQELLALSFPLMISALATMAMIFTDRIFLAHYSIGALNASVNAGTLAWAISGGLGMATGMAEVFVAQYNGAKRYSEIGAPVWQMIWVSLASVVFFVPLALWASPLIFGSDAGGLMEQDYFKWMMAFGPSYALLTSLSSFFIGRGRTKLLLWLAVAMNGINIVLDWLLIFGVPGLIPEMGIEGAAIGTCVGSVFQVLILFFLFIREDNRVQFGTGNWKLDWEQMRRCIQVGAPQGVFYGLELLGMSVFYWMMSSISEQHITVSSICQSLLLLLYFFPDGLSRGLAAVAGNMIGAKKFDLVNKAIRSALLIQGLFTLGTAALLFTELEATLNILFLDGATNTALLPVLQACLMYLMAFLFFEGLRWIYGGVLAAAGDTMFLLIAGTFSIWAFLVVPAYFIVVRHSLSVEIAWMLAAVASGLAFVGYWVRYHRGSWRQIDLIERTPAEVEE